MARLLRDVETQTLTIANGATTSDAFAAGGLAMFGIIMPAAFTGTSITFTVSSTFAGTYVPLYDSTGTAVTATTAGTSRAIDCPTQLAAFPFWKIVSGSTEGGARSIVVIGKG